MMKPPHTGTCWVKLHTTTPPYTLPCRRSRTECQISSPGRSLITDQASARRSGETKEHITLHYLFRRYAGTLMRRNAVVIGDMKWSVQLLWYHAWTSLCWYGSPVIHSMQGHARAVWHNDRDLRCRYESGYELIGQAHSAGGKGCALPASRHVL